MTKEKPIIIIGKSSHSKVIKEAALVSGRLIYKILDFKKINSRFLKTNKENFDFIVAIGDNKLRKIIFNKLKKKSCNFTKIIHPSAIISQSAKIKKGSFIAAGVIITNNVLISENCIINTGSRIDHNTSIGAHSHVAPGVKIAGRVTIGNLCFIGVGSIVRDGIKISNRVLLGAGAVAVSDLNENSTYLGIPAKKQINFQNLKILLLGREKCKFSEKIFKYLKKNKINTTFLKTNNKNKNLILKKLKNFRKFNFDYLLSFRNLIVLKKTFLDKIKVASINFHPGPPEYRGIGCANFAIINQEKKYGCTTHLMDEKIDNGKILDVRYFNLKKNTNINILTKKTHILIFEMFLDFFEEVFKNRLSIKTLVKRNKNMKWSNKLYNRKQLNDLYKIDPKINKEKLNILLRASNYLSFKPYLEKNGKKFFYIKKNIKKGDNYISLFNKNFFH